MQRVCGFSDPGLPRGDPQRHRPGAPRLTHHDREQLAVARKLIDDSYSAPPSLSALARRVGPNRNKLCAGFQAEYGLTIHEYARELRLQKALLLREGGISITEVALEVGHEHSSSLATAAKKRFGFSPKQLQQKSKWRRDG